MCRTNLSSLASFHHNEIQNHEANVSYYFTAKNDTVAEVVRFFHEAWGHPNVDRMVDIVAQNVYMNTPKALTPTIIRKYFPTCESCVIANMHKRPHARSIDNR